MKPKIYYYEHCPYCVRVLTFLKLSQIDFDAEVLANDDEKTPISMVGKKMLPILQTGAESYMGESLDIIDYLRKTYDISLDGNAEWVEQVERFLDDNKTAIYGLAMPRWVQTDFKEFATQSAKDYFIKKKAPMVGDFQQAIANTPSLCADLMQGLQEARPLFVVLNEMPRSLAAIMLFSGLYGLKDVEELAWTAESQHFMQTLATATQQPFSR